MDLHMDLRVGFDEDFTFGSQSQSCSSTSSSFSCPSTASSSQDPFTPASGRSTPGLHPMLMDHDAAPCGTSGGFDLTPPASAFGGYFPSDVKGEFAHYVPCEVISASPSRRASVQASTMDFDYPSMMSTSLASQSSTIQAPNPQVLGHYQFADHITSSPLAFSTPAYTLDNGACYGQTSWGWPADGPVAFFERHDSPALSSPVRDLSLRDRNSMTPSFLASHNRRRLCVDEVQHKTSALHRAQHGHRQSMKREKSHKRYIEGGAVSLIPKGSFHCQHADCLASGRKPFKRQEHLKRHFHTCHAPQPDTNTTCIFCHRCFNRRDNYRQHLKLHAQKDRAISRTKYFPEAQALYDEEMAKTKQRSQQKKGTPTPSDRDDDII
ncbi:hypothetical protein F5Y15DRAFT_418089 [Xylariaceae sp. FL0016]|nr:hypothetical protein F5Y15DRAFT_418089 [Xylariaceae sp. FL0016]